MKCLLITGVSKGIGSYLANYYLERDFLVIGCSRTKPEIDHIHFEWHCVDVSQENDIKELFSNLKMRKKKLYGLINNAGIATMNPFLLTPKNTAVKIINTNLIGTFLMMQESVKMMLRYQQGRIINFSSIANALNLEGESIYSASKAAIESLTKTGAREFASANITVNAVGPGPIATDLLKNIGEERLNNVIDRQAIKRMTQMEDMANVCDFFLSEKSKMITGQIIHLGGVSQ